MTKQLLTALTLMLAIGLAAPSSHAQWWRGKGDKTAEIENMKELTEANDMLNAQMKLLGDKDPKKVSAAALELGKLHYQEAMIALTERLIAELEKPKPNSFIIMQALESLEKIGSKDIEAGIKTAETLFKKDHKSNTWSSQIEEQFDDTLARVKIGPESLPKLADRLAAAQGNDGQTKAKTFKEFLEKEGGPAGNAIAKSITGVLTDNVRELKAKGEEFKIYGREAEAQRALDIMVRIKGKAPIYTGPAGVGKTTAAERLAQIIVDAQYVQSPVFKKNFENAEIIITTPAKISKGAQSNLGASQADAIESFLTAVLDFEKYHFEKFKKAKPIIIFIDEIHTLSPEQAEALLTFLDSKQNAVRLLGATNTEKFMIKFKDNEALLRRIEWVALEEFSVPQTIELLKLSWLEPLEKEYNVRFEDRAIEAAVTVAKRLKPDISRPDGPFKVLQDIAIREHRRQNGSAATINEKLIYDFTAEITGLPSNPRDGRQFEEYLKGLAEKGKNVVAGQDPLIDGIVQEYGSMLLGGGSNRPRVVTLMGGPGVGKTLIGETLARSIYGNEKRFFRIDGNEMSTGNYSVNTYFGAPNGVISSDKTPGKLMAWLDDPAQGKYGGVILIDEGDKMHADAWKAFMEFFDQGAKTGGDGKTRYANNHLVIITSNQGARAVFPASIQSWSEEEIDRRMKNLTSQDLKDLFIQSTVGSELQLPPEVVNRVDQFLLARPSTPGNAVVIGHRETVKLVELAKTFGMKLEVDENLIKHLALTGFSSAEGNRHVKRQIDTNLRLAIRTARAEWDMTQDTVVKVDLYFETPGSQPKIRIRKEEQNGTTAPTALYIPAPVKKFDNPLEDRAMVQKIQNLPKVLADNLIGQDHIIRSLGQIVTAGLIQKANRAKSIYLIGSTGTGKTETARALALGLYGSKDRAAIIPLGNVKWDGDLNEVFGPKAGFSGHKDPWLFEQALMNNPDGGVIVFDEASNMGGNDKNVKAELFKKFYNIMDERYWTSPVNGRKYDLSKYYFVFTGNDSESLFMGISSDELRLSIYKQNNSREKVRALLREAGIPEAFIGRLLDMVMAKPLLRKEVGEITRKLLNGQIAEFEKLNQGVKVEYNDAFVRQFSESFFSQDQGARSIRAVLESRLNAVISTALMESGFDPSERKEITLKLAMSDSQTKKAYTTISAPARLAEIVIEVHTDGALKNISKIDVTEFAAHERVMGIRGARITAVHEAGHAIFENPELTGLRLSHYTIRGGSLRGMEYLGYAHYEPVGSPVNPTRESTIWQAAGLLAGGMAQEMAGFPADAGHSNDLEKVGQLISSALLEYGLDPELRGVPRNKRGEPVLNARMKKIYDAKYDQYLNEAKELSRKMLTDSWPLIRLMTAEVLKTGYVSGKRVRELKQAELSGKAKAHSLAYIARRDQRRTEPRSPLVGICRSLIAR